MRRLFSLLAFVASGAAFADTPPAPTYGFYPLWENTGNVLEHRAIYLGSSQAGFGINNRVQLGFEPVQFVYRVPNLNAKVAFFRGEELQLAASLGANILLHGASEAFLSPMYNSAIDNPDFNVKVFTAAQSSSWRAADWLSLHATLSLMGVPESGLVRGELTPGASLVAELLARQHHSIFAHLGNVGLWKNAFSFYGGSYRYLSSSGFELRVGYFYRQNRDGLQAAPMVSLGAYL